MTDPSYSLTGYQIKYIALISMFLDHFRVVAEPYIPYSLYLFLHGIGRLAFPIFCFFLAEGFYYTKNRRAYLMRLILFGILSELPFDIALQSSLKDDLAGPFSWAAQNVMFTMAIGFGLMMLLTKYSSHRYDQLRLGFIILALLLAEALHVDYGAVGVCTILLFYYRKRNHPDQNEVSSLAFCMIPLVLLSLAYPIQLVCILSLVPLSLYRQERGKGWKYLFYVFYPAHLLLLYALVYLLF